MWTGCNVQPASQEVQMEAERPPLPPFTAESAAQKVRLAEDAWNTRTPDRVALAYTPDSYWRNRSEFFQGRDAIVAFLTPEVGSGTPVSIGQGIMGFPPEPHRCALRL